MTRMSIAPLFVLLAIGSAALLPAQIGAQTSSDVRPVRVQGLPFAFRYLVDETSARYRTGEPDPAIHLVPDRITEALRTIPGRGIEELGSFLLYDGGPAGPARDEFHYVKRIYDWITANVAYDTYLLAGVAGHEGSRFPSTFLTYPSGPRSTCGGYSRLFYQLAVAGGIETRHINGLTRRYVSDSGTIGDHAWNAVRIGGRWYIVDTTAGGRSTQNGESRTELEAYSDRWLFLAPEAMLVTNFAEEAEDQLVASPISWQQFEALPQFSSRFFAYGLELPDESIADRVETLISRGDGRWYDREDLYAFDQRGMFELPFKSPRSTYVTASLYDLSGTRIHDHAFAAIEHPSAAQRTAVAMFSAPGSGMYRGVVRARPIDQPGTSWTVYSFYLQSSGQAGPLLPQKNVLAVDQRSTLYDISVGTLVEPSADRPYWQVDVELGSDTEVVAGIRGIGVPDPSGHRFSSYPGPDRQTWYITPPPRGDYHVILWARRPGEERYNDRIAQFRIRSDRDAGTTLPPDVLRVRQQMHDQGVELADLRLEPGRLVVEVTYPENIQISSAILDDRDNKRDPATDERYTRAFRTINRPAPGTIVLTFDSPSADRIWRVRIYGRRLDRDEGRSWTLIEHRIPGQAQ